MSDQYLLDTINELKQRIADLEKLLILEIESKDSFRVHRTEVGKRVAKRANSSWRKS